MKTPREVLVETSLLQALRNSGEYLVPEDILEKTLRLEIPRLAKSEFDRALREVDSHRRAMSIDGELARKWRITDEGRAWLQEVGI